jgi:diguanylate cyclase (GGDEF)-like protein
VARARIGLQARWAAALLGGALLLPTLLCGSLRAAVPQVQVLPLWAAPAGIAASAPAQAFLDDWRRCDTARAPTRAQPPELPLEPSAPTLAYQVLLPAGKPDTAHVIYAKDLILARLVALVPCEAGRVDVRTAGRTLPFDARSLPSPFPNIRIQSTGKPQSVTVLMQDRNTVRAWLEVEPEDSFQRLTTQFWMLLGGYTVLLLVLALMGLNYAVLLRSKLAVAYVVYICCLQFYQLQALGLGPAWLPFWPQQEHFQLMQALAVAGVVLGIGLAVVAFLAPRGVLLWMLIIGVGSSVVLFVASAWIPQAYRLGAMSLALMAAATFAALLRGLRDEQPYRRWFALGLAATMLGGGTQAASVFMQAPPPLAIAIAFPLGTLVESVFWLISIASRVGSDRRALQAQLVHEARHDALTGLPNRRHLTEHIGTLLDKAAADAGAARDDRTASNTAGALLYVDLDGFKAINDSLGHELGDRLLVHVGALLRRNVPAGALVARLGSDEFGVLLPAGMDGNAAAARVLAAFAAPVVLAERPMRVRCSIGGVALAPRYRDADAVLRDAGAALGAAKAAGGKRVEWFAEPMHASALRRFELEQALDAALDSDGLCVAYQPIVTLADGHAVGLEALSRWRHPRLGLISPAEIVPLAERCGLIHRLGERVLGDVAEQVAHWQRTGAWPSGFYVGVNLSGGQLLDDSLLQRIEALLKSHRVNADALRIELTETAVIANLDVALHVLPALRRRGIALCMDDFGTGYSSLSYLSKLPFDVIKIDRSFVTGCHRHHANRALIRTILAMARQLDMSVVAEGIETADEAALLRGLGCRYGQGWHYAKAASAAAIAPWLQAAAVPAAH